MTAPTPFLIPPERLSPVFIVIMGVSGCGKSTIAERLADEIGGVFLEGDAGIPLEDVDRWPWFNRLVEVAGEALASGLSPVLACSALKESYREYLFRDFPQHRLVYLHGSFDLIKGRMDAREHEYMTSDLLRSQFATLEAPASHPDLLTLSIERNPDEMIAALREWLGNR